MAAVCPPGTPSYRRSPFLVVEWSGRDLILVNCETLRRFRVDDRLLAILSLLDAWATADDLKRAGQQVSAEDLSRLAALGVLQEGAPGDHEDAQTFWNPYDLMVQRQHNIGGYRESDLRARGEQPPAAFKPRPSGPSWVLPVAPQLPGSLDEVLSGRRTLRTFGSRALQLAELSALLYHSARVIRTAYDELLGEHVFRPFPTGGARSELEIYIVVNHVSGLPAGAYYYDPQAHDLVQVKERDDHQDRVVRWAHAATGHLQTYDPHAILLITAVFARVMWKYHGIGLGLIYRDVGCLYQTLYLAATALGLAPCAMGAGKQEINARWLGLDPLVESQVGCFLLGTR